jgi:hypothetical protein
MSTHTHTHTQTQIIKHFNNLFVYLFNASHKFIYIESF